MTDTDNTPNPDFCGYDFSVWKRMTPQEQRAARAERDAAIVRERREQLMAYQLKLDEERKARSDAAAAERDKLQRERLVASVRRAYLAEGGDEAGWEKAKTRLVNNAIEKATMERQTSDRAAMRARLGSKF